MAQGDSHSMSDRLRGELRAEHLDLAFDCDELDDTEAGYVAGVQAVREVAEYFDLGRGQRVAARPGQFGEVPGEVAFGHDERMPDAFLA